MRKKFDYLGVFFVCSLFEKFGTGNYDETFKYLRELGFNMSILVDSIIDNYRQPPYILWKSSKSLSEGIPAAKKYFDVNLVHIGSGHFFYPQFFSELGLKLSPQFYKYNSLIHEKGLIYYYDEPVLDVWDFTSLVNQMKNRGGKVAVTFGGSNYSYMKEFIDTGCTLDYYIIDIYPIGLLRSDEENEKEILKMESEIKEVRQLLSGKKMIFIMQMCATPNSIRYPSLNQMKQMMDICLMNDVDGVVFFIWNSGWTGMEALSGMDILPFEYHKLASTYAPNIKDR